MNTARGRGAAEIAFSLLVGLLPLLLSRARIDAELPSLHGGVDPLLQAGILQHVIHHPLLAESTWHAPFFWPARWSLTFMDPMALQSVLVGWIPIVRGGVATAYNVSMVAGLFMACLSTIRLGRALGLSTRAAWLAAGIYAAGPYAAGHYHHLNQLPTLGLPLVVLGMLRVHRGQRHGLPLVCLGGVAQILGGIYQSAALYLALLCLLPTLWGMLDRRRGLLLALTLAMLVAVTVLGSIPYRHAAVELEGFGRGVLEAGAFSGRPFDLLHPPRVHLSPWPSPLPGRPVMYLGLFWPWMAIAGFWLWRKHADETGPRRLVTAMLVLSALGLILAFGRRLPLPGAGEISMPFAWLQDAAWPLRALRAPTRLLLPASLAMALFGAYLVDQIRRIPSRGLRLLAGAGAVIAVLDLAPGALERVRAEPDDDERALLAGLAEQPDLWAWSLVPQACTEREETERDARLMIWAALIGRPVAGGASGYVPVEVARIRRVCCPGPGEFCLDELEGAGVSHLVQWEGGTPPASPERAQRIGEGRRWTLWRLR